MQFEFKGSNRQSMETRHFDVVVIGSGSAGAIVAHRVATTGARVALIEAGASDRNPMFRVPLLTGILHRQRYANWYFMTEPIPTLGGRSLLWPRGKVLGGSSAINGMIYVRGLPADYDRWAQDGLPEWSADRVRPFFDRTVRRAGDRRAIAASVPVGPVPPSNPLFDVFLAAAGQAGWPMTDDFNAVPYGAGRYRFTIEDGERWSTGRAFLSKRVRPATLTILLKALALRIRFEGRRARYVETEVGGSLTRIGAERIVLCAGAVNSPALLLRSGIGPAEELRSLGVSLVEDLPGVGRNLQDHLLVRVQHTCREPITLHNLMRPDRAAFAVLRAMLTGKGPAASFPLEAGAYIKSRPGLDAPDLQCHFLPGLSTAALRLPFRKLPSTMSGQGFFANCYQMRPESRGRIRLRSANPHDPPRIEPGYLTDRRDLEILREGVKRLREIFAQAAFDRYRGDEVNPGPAVRTDAEIEDYIARTAETVYHPVGTAKMGNGPDAVVDGQLRVRGVEGLWVADASIMPTITSANTHAPTMMIGEKAAEIVANAR